MGTPNGLDTAAALLSARVARLELWCVVLAAMNGAQIVGHLSARWL
jgi:hypothetical protein